MGALQDTNSAGFVSWQGLCKQHQTTQGHGIRPLPLRCVPAGLPHGFLDPGNANNHTGRSLGRSVVRWDGRAGPGFVLVGQTDLDEPRRRMTKPDETRRNTKPGETRRNPTTPSDTPRNFAKSNRQHDETLRVVWLVGWLVGWWDVWLVGCLLGLVASLLVEGWKCVWVGCLLVEGRKCVWLGDCLGVWLVHWFCWLVCWSVWFRRSVGRCRSDGRLIDFVGSGRAGRLGSGFAGRVPRAGLAGRFAGSPVGRSVGWLGLFGCLVWQFRNLEIWEFENLKIWGFGNMRI